MISSVEEVIDLSFFLGRNLFSMFRGDLQSDSMIAELSAHQKNRAFQNSAELPCKKMQAKQRTKA